MVGVVDMGVAGSWDRMELGWVCLAGLLIWCFMQACCVVRLPAEAAAADWATPAILLLHAGF